MSWFLIFFQRKKQLAWTFGVSDCWGGDGCCPVIPYIPPNTLPAVAVMAQVWSVLKQCFVFRKKEFSKVCLIHSASYGKVQSRQQKSALLGVIVLCRADTKTNRLSACPQQPSGRRTTCTFFSLQSYKLNIKYSYFKVCLQFRREYKLFNLLLPEMKDFLHYWCEQEAKKMLLPVKQSTIQYNLFLLLKLLEQEMKKNVCFFFLLWVKENCLF